MSSSNFFFLVTELAYCGIAFMGERHILQLELRLVVYYLVG